MGRPSPQSHRSDDYGNIVAAFGPRYRAIVEPNGLGWAVQHRRSDKGRWFTTAHQLTHRGAIESWVWSNFYSGYAGQHGITPATINATLAHLPEVFQHVPHDHLIVYAPDLPRRLTAFPSYKTENDIHRYDR